MNPNYRNLHVAAGYFWQSAWWKPQISHRRDVIGEVLELKLAAYELQLMAAEWVYELRAKEPDRAVVMGTLANKAFELGKIQDAKLWAGRVLQGTPPKNIKKDMRRLLIKTNTETK